MRCYWSAHKARGLDRIYYHRARIYIVHSEGNSVQGAALPLRPLRLCGKGIALDQT